MLNNRTHKTSLSHYSKARPKFRLPWTKTWNLLDFDSEAPRHILDVGCGTGRSSRWLITGAEYVTGIDRDWESIQTAKSESTNSNITYMECCAEKLDSSHTLGRKIDAVLFCGSLEWVDLVAFKKRLSDLDVRSVPVVCQWTWFDCSDPLTREWHTLFRKFLGHQFGQEPDESFWKAHVYLTSPRHITGFFKQPYTTSELENLVKSSTSWHAESLPWGAEGLRESVARFVKEHVDTGKLDLCFVEHTIGGLLKCP